MNEKDRKLINQFKAEYKARLYYDERLKSLEEKRRKLMDQFSIHSPSLDGVRVTPQSLDFRHAEAATATKSIEDEQSSIRKQIERIDGILCEIEPYLRKHMYMIYSGHYNYAEAAAREGISERKMKYDIDKAILEAIKKRGLY